MSMFVMAVRSTLMRYACLALRAVLEFGTLLRRNFRQLLTELIDIASVTKARQPFDINLAPVGEDFDPRV